MRRLAIAAGVVVLVAASAFGGYHYAMRHSMPIVAAAPGASGRAHH